MIPRIRGKVGEISEPIEHKGKFAFELSLWDFTGETLVGPPWTIGPFDSEETAHKEMKIAIKLVCEDIEKRECGEPSGKFLDMKNGGVLRTWVEQ